MARSPRPPSGHYARDTDKFYARIRRALREGSAARDRAQVERAVDQLLVHVRATRQTAVMDQLGPVITRARFACAPLRSA